MAVEVSAAPAPAAGLKPFARLTDPRVYLTLAGLSALLVVPALADSPFVAHVFVTICVYAALSTAWNIVGGYAGQLSLGTGPVARLPAIPRKRQRGDAGTARPCPRQVLGGPIPLAACRVPVPDDG